MQLLQIIYLLGTVCPNTSLRYHLYQSLEHVPAKTYISMFSYMIVKCPRNESRHFGYFKSFTLHCVTLRLRLFTCPLFFMLLLGRQSRKYQTEIIQNRAATFGHDLVSKITCSKSRNAAPSIHPQSFSLSVQQMRYESDGTENLH